MTEKSTTDTPRVAKAAARTGFMDVPAAPVVGTHPLAAMQAKLMQELRAAGYTVKAMEPSPTNQLQATFIPRRRVNKEDSKV